MGYDKDESGNLVINEKQAKVVRRIYSDYLNGKGTNRIAHELEKEASQTGTVRQSGTKAASKRC
jgi:DNA invertase Pin-like site-specific DNA recombinase